MKNKSGIYEIFNTVNGKRYIGSAKKLGHRWWSHTRDLKLGTHHNRHLQASWDVHGADVFVFHPLLICAPTKEMLLMYEQRAIDTYDPEYNIMRIADSHQGVKRSLETRARLSAALTGKRHSDETKEKIRLIRIGTTASAATKAKMSATQSAIPHQPLTAETKAKLSALWIGTTRTEEDRRKIAEGQRGKKKKPHTAETRARLSAALKGRPVAPDVLARRIGRKQLPETIAKRCKPHTAETKAKMSAAHVARFAALRVARMGAARQVFQAPL